MVRERYTEIHKAKTEPEIKEIIKMQADFMVDEQTYNNVISFFEEIKDLDPILSIGDPQYVQPTETGERAKFKAKSGRTYRLFKMKSGRWGFHM